MPEEAGRPSLGALLRMLDPVPSPERYAYVRVDPAEAGHLLETTGWVAAVREAEGTTVVLPAEAAFARGLPVSFVAAMVTLGVDSALDACGLTAAVASALADAGIACNVVAGVHHDHLFVPFDRAADALGVLDELAAGAPDPGSTP